MRAGAYRTQYGEDSSWIELRYREGEALGPADPRRREVFADVVEHHRATYWAAGGLGEQGWMVRIPTCEGAASEARAA